MALPAGIGSGGTFFMGEDKTLSLEVIDTSSVPVDIAGWTILFLIRPATDSATITYSAQAGITGVYNSNRVTNTQRAAVNVTQAITSLWREGHYQHSWKRTDSGSETVLAYGDLVIERATQVA